MRKLIKSAALLCFVLLMAFSGPVSASSGQVVGLGHNFAALEGTGALLSNPALVNPADDSLTLELNGQVAIWNNGINSKYFNQYIDEADKDNILSNIDSDGLVLMGKGSQDIRLIIGSVGLFGGVKESGLGTISKDIVELVLKGNEIGEVYRLTGTDMSSAVYADTGVNFSLPVQSLADRMEIDGVKLGGTFHYLYGGIVKFTGEGEARLDYDTNTADGSIEMKYTEESRGTAFDLGASFAIDDRLTVAASLMNLGSISSDNHTYSKMQFVVDEENEEMVETEEVAEEEVVAEELKYSLPREFKIGTRYELNKKLDLYADYSHISYDLGKTEHRLAAATEFTPIGILPLRFGVSYSTLQKDLMLSGGMGVHLGPVQLDLGFSDISAFTQNAKSVEGGVSVKMAF